MPCKTPTRKQQRSVQRRRGSSKRGPCTQGPCTQRRQTGRRVPQKTLVYDGPGRNNIVSSNVLIYDPVTKQWVQMCTDIARNLGFSCCEADYTVPSPHSKACMQMDGPTADAFHIHEKDDQIYVHDSSVVCEAMETACHRLAHGW